MDLSIVIPIHNEQDALPSLIAALRRNLDRLELKAEVVFVDDASTDDSRSILQQAEQQDDRLRLVTLPRRGGQTGCYRVGFGAARGATILRMDGDMQDNPDDLPLFEAKIKEGCEIVVGLREVRQHPLPYRIASRVFDLLMLVAFDSPFHENSVSFAAFKAEFVRQVQLKDGDHRFLVPIALSCGPKKVGEVVVRHGKRLGGRSKYRMLSKFASGSVQLLGVLARLKRGYYQRQS